MGVTQDGRGDSPAEVDVETDVVVSVVQIAEAGQNVAASANYPASVLYQLKSVAIGYLPSIAGGQDLCSVIERGGVDLSTFETAGTGCVRPQGISTVFPGQAETVMSEIPAIYLSVVAHRPDDVLCSGVAQAEAFLAEMSCEAEELVDIGVACGSRGDITGVHAVCFRIDEHGHDGVNDIKPLVVPVRNHRSAGFFGDGLS